MLAMPTRRSSIVVLFVAVVFAAIASADHSWGGYHWARTSNPFTLLAGDNVSSAWDAHLDEAIGDWNLSSVLDLQKVAGGTNPRNCRPTSGRIEVCSSKYGFNGWLGIAQIWITGGVHIVQATTKVNDSYFNTATYNTYSWRQLVMCQEIAHDFGLDHQDENFDNANLGSCMDYTSSPEGNEHPNQHDYEQIETIYAHVDSFNSYSAESGSGGGGGGRGGGSGGNRMPPAMNQIDFDAPGQWGRLVSSSRNGRVQVYELDFGGGNRVLTHVFWADPQADAR